MPIFEQIMERCKDIGRESKERSVRVRERGPAGRSPHAWGRRAGICSCLSGFHNGPSYTKRFTPLPSVGCAPHSHLLFASFVPHALSQSCGRLGALRDHYGLKHPFRSLTRSTPSPCLCGLNMNSTVLNFRCVTCCPPPARFFHPSLTSINRH